MSGLEDLQRAISEHQEEKSPAGKAAYRGIYTTQMVPPLEIRKVVGMVSATVVRAAGPIGEIAINLRDMFGGRSNEAEYMLDRMRIEALDRLRQNATMAGGNAVVAATCRFSEFGNNVFIATAEGTAVIAEKP